MRGISVLVKLLNRDEADFVARDEAIRLLYEANSAADGTIWIIDHKIGKLAEGLVKT